MKRKKAKRINYNTSVSEDENQIKSFIIITIVIMAVIGIIYGCTELLSKKKSTEKSNTEQSVTINYDRIAIGMLLNRPYDNYYVLIYDSKGKNAVSYSTILSSYMAKKSEKNYIKIYYCDLNNSLNSSYYNVNNDNRSNPKAKKIDELDLGEITLISVKNGKIDNYIESVNKIKEILK